MKKFRPLHDRVVIRRVAEKDVTEGGIIIPPSAKEKPQEGIVAAVGNGTLQNDGTLRKLDVQEGDRILFGKYSGSEIKVEGEQYIILRESEILGVIE
jgi:chaperonin GroES